MKSQIFINLPVKELEKSLNFYTKMGFTNNPQFSDDTAKCMVFIEAISINDYNNPYHNPLSAALEVPATSFLV